MTTRFVPYAATPGRAMLQVTADITVLVWVIIWFVVGRFVHTAIQAFATVGTKVQSGANGIASNLDSAGHGADKIPLVGNAVSSPLTGAGSAARNLADAGAGLHDKATTLSWVLALAVALPPILAVVVPWLLLRLRFARRAAATAELSRSPGGDELLALRAMANRPLRRVLAISSDPLESWRMRDPEVVSRLAALELRGVGLK